MSKTTTIRRMVSSSRTTRSSQNKRPQTTNLSGAAQPPPFLFRSPPACSASLQGIGQRRSRPPPAATACAAIDRPPSLRKPQENLQSQPVRGRFCRVRTQSAAQYYFAKLPPYGGIAPWLRNIVYAGTGGRPGEISPQMAQEVPEKRRAGVRKRPSSRLLPLLATCSINHRLAGRRSNGGRNGCTT